MHLLIHSPEGIYCPPGDFHIDPWRKVRRAVVSHAHSDHARPGSEAYLLSRSGLGVSRERLGTAAVIETLDWGESTTINGVRVSLHPAGHVLGSAQVRVEYRGEVWVYTGDYKRAPDPSCETFEPVPCSTLITECTFGLPIYRWPDPAEEFARIHQWWRANRAAGRTSVLFAYALGKAQRILAGLDASIGPVGVHGAVERFLPHYAAAGRRLVPAEKISAENAARFRGSGLVIAPGSAEGTPWLRKLAPFSLAFASGWVLVRGNRRRRALDRGFVLSDHADWPGLLATVRETGASRILPTHGSTETFARYLRERGFDAEPFGEVPFTGEASEEEDA